MDNPPAILLPDGFRLIKYEEWTLTGLLGIRLWDPAYEVPVRDGLVVTARSRLAGGPPAEAMRTGAGVYAFHRLPGPGAAAAPGMDSPPAGSPPEAQRWIIEVRDRWGRFMPMTVTVQRPDNGGPVNVFLLDGPNRVPQPGFVAVRGLLRDRSTGAPAAYALVEVDRGGGKAWYGVTDDRGAVTIIVPCPVVLGSTPMGSPPVLVPPPAADYSWEVTLRVRKGTRTPAPPAGAAYPDLVEITGQPPALIYSTVASPATPRAEQQIRLYIGREHVLRTDSQSWLLIDPGVTSPEKA